ncbi:MAG: phosphoadenosine phosphosulfate reductase family protein [Deltaproteobacteria bacterium]|nr:phosphoadenosine phosphosulfate reductase family protein [Deltaproteobacteria bacterium]
MKEFKEKPNESENQTNHRPAIQANNLFQMFSSISRRIVVRETGQGDCNSYAKGQADLFAVFGRTTCCLGGLMKALACSGGKDSTATALLLIEREIEFTPVFCDTGWEHDLTLEYLDYLNDKLFDGKLVTVKSEQYPNGMRDLCTKKGRVPSAKARFCTEALKIKPMIDWIFRQDPEVETVFQGIRADESASRAKMNHREWADYYNAWCERPILTWNTKQVFEIHKKHEIKPNPLYKMGAGRVGCFPCVLVNHAEIRGMQDQFPELWERISELERMTSRSFFPPNMIPDRFQTGHDPKSGKSFPIWQDVQKYLASHESQGQLSFMEPSKCMSVYNLCE